MVAATGAWFARFLIYFQKILIIARFSLDGPIRSVGSTKMFYGSGQDLRDGAEQPVNLRILQNITLPLGMNSGQE